MPSLVVTGSQIKEKRGGGDFVTPAYILPNQPILNRVKKLKNLFIVLKNLEKSVKFFVQILRKLNKLLYSLLLWISPRTMILEEWNFTCPDKKSVRQQVGTCCKNGEDLFENFGGWIATLLAPLGTAGGQGTLYGPSWSKVEIWWDPAFYCSRSHDLLFKIRQRNGGITDKPALNQRILDRSQHFSADNLAVRRPVVGM